MADLILLVGNPNAGKSTLFNRITRGHARVGNWHGVTVGVLEKTVNLGGREVTVADLPGIYGAAGTSMEEKLACETVSAHPEAFLLFVSECATLERTVKLMAELTRGGRRAALVLTKYKQFRRAGGQLDEEELAALGLPVFFAEKKALPAWLSAALERPPVQTSAVKLVTFRAAREGLSRADKWLLNGFFGIPFFFLLVLAAFFLTFARGMPGDLMKSGVEAFFGDFLGGYAERIASPVARSFVRDGLLSSLGGVLCFLPQILLLYLFLILLEESGLMSRLAILTDGFFSRLGLNGRAAFSLLMGFGCTAAAILTTRGLDDRKIQRRVILCLPYVSCSAKLPVFLTLSASFFREPFVAVALLYLFGLLIAVLLAILMRGDEAPSFILELAPLQLPSPLFVAKSLLFQLKQFIIKVATVILAFFLASWLLSSFDFGFRLAAVEDSMLARICGGLKFLFAPIGMGDWRIAYAALSGLIAKENIAGALAMFYGGFPYGAASAVAFSMFVLTCSPCVSAIAATARETGYPRALLYAAAQTGSALLLSYLVYFALTGGAISLAFLLVPLAASILLGKHVKKVYRHRADDAQKLHRRHRRAGFLRLQDAAPHAPDPRMRQARRRRSSLKGGG